MKFSAVLLLGVAAVAIASPATTEASVSPTASPTLTPQAKCLAGCKSSDVNCQAACLGMFAPWLMDGWMPLANSHRKP